VTPLLIGCILIIPTTALLSAAFASFMRRRSIGQQIRAIGPDGHARKIGTPTMGGIVVLAVWILGTAALGSVYPLTLRSAFILASGILFAAIGAADDLISIRKRRSLGLSPLQKIFLSSLVTVALFFGFSAVFKTPLRVPFSSLNVTLPPVGSFFLAWFVFLATTNGMNLTDGLDGLASGTTILILIGTVLLSPTLENIAITVPLIAALGKRPSGPPVPRRRRIVRPRRDRRWPRDYVLPAPAWSETAITTRFLIIEALFLLLAILAGR